MTIGIWILGDQLSFHHPALQELTMERDQISIILIESMAYAQKRPYHRQKLVLVWSAMRHFARELGQEGWQVTYEIAPEFSSALTNWQQTYSITELWIMEPGDRPFIQFINQLNLTCSIHWLPNNLFLWKESEFTQWAQGRKRLLLEDFYREGRKRFNVLMKEGKPIGGQWNLDKQNRKPPKKGLISPPVLWFPPDPTTQGVITHVHNHFPHGYGEVDTFRWAVTRPQARRVLSHFLETHLPDFGPYQDAMVTGEDTLWHSLLSPYLNLGLLHPMEVIQAVQEEYNKRQLNLNSVEGFIRQILGWREYMRGLYMYETKRDPNYTQHNWFNHNQPLPHWFWTGITDLNCLHQTLEQIHRTGYAHHIQRLMLLSNFNLILGTSPQSVVDWFHAVFIDAYDWVMQTNVIGMGLFADGGLLASKPYAASANYINKMSNYCGGCVYNPKARTGEGACPFNFLYWDFLARHRQKLQSQGRLNLILSQLDRIPPEELAMMQKQSDAYRLNHLGLPNVVI